MSYIIPLLIYFSPTIVAAYRYHPSFKKVFAANIFIGWTGIAWFICLSYAMSDLSVEEDKPKLEKGSAFLEFANSESIEIKTLAERGLSLENNLNRREQDISSIISAKYVSTELTASRFSSTAWSVIESARMRLGLTVSLLQGLRALSETNIHHNENFQLQIEKANNYLDDCQTAIEKLANFIATISQTSIQSGMPATSIEIALEDLIETTKRISVKVNPTNEAS